MNDGTFGVTGECEPFEEELVSRVESHRYDPVKVLQWRSGELNFNSVPALLDSLEAPPPERGLVRARPASDAIALRHLSNDPDVMARAVSPATRCAGYGMFVSCPTSANFRKTNMPARSGPSSSS